MLNENKSVINREKELTEFFEKVKSFSSFLEITIGLIKGSLDQFDRPFFWTESDVLEEKKEHLMSIQSNLGNLIKWAQSITDHWISQKIEMDDLFSKKASTLIRVLKWFGMDGFLEDDTSTLLDLKISLMKAHLIALKEHKQYFDTMINLCTKKDYSFSSWYTSSNQLTLNNKELLRLSIFSLEQLN